MHSQSEYIITKQEVHGYANQWLGAALKLEYQGYKCTDTVLLQILLIAAARVVSIFSACHDLADAPSDDTVRNALFATLPEIAELEKRLNRSLCTELPKALTRKSRKIAIDLTLIPYHGEPAFDEKEIYRSKPKAGTSHFHAYATAVVVHKGYRYTLALTYVQRGEALKEVLKRLVRLVRKQGVKIKYTLLDKEFCSVDIMQYLRRAKYGFIIAAPVRGRKKKNQPATGMRALKKKKNGYYSHTFTRKEKGKTKRVKVTICVSGKSGRHKKTGKKRYKKLLYAIWKVRKTPRQIREEYRKRFGVETSYRQMNEARIKTSTRDPRFRLLFIGIALVLRNVWVWLHFRLAKNTYSEEPQMFLELMRFKEMLLWITQIVQRNLGADKTEGIKVVDYQRLAAIKSGA